MKDVVRSLVREALTKAIKNNSINVPDLDAIDIEVTRTKDEKFGDFASNVAMVLARTARAKPRDLAAIIVENIDSNTDVLEKTEIAGPGFINFFLTEQVWHTVLHTILKVGSEYGRSEGTKGPKILLEFVSANPTGPLHVGHGRGAAVGDTLARLLKSCGYRVDTEYYVNDAGNQMRILGESVLLRLREMHGERIDFPEKHYQGDYIKDLAQDLSKTDLGDKILGMQAEDAVEEASKFARESILGGIKDDLASFGVHYDNYFSEKKLHESGEILAAIERLRELGRVEEKDGAVWFTVEGDGDEKDRVLKKATGEYTYFAADAAYHEEKLRRGYDRLVDIWGSDHHGYVPRVKSAMEAFGKSPDMLRVLLVQFVTLVREGEKLSMSTRAGEFITLKEVLDEVGSDAARFFFLTKRCDSHLDFDLDLAKKHSKDNPVYYVQYAHARVASIFRIADERSIDVDLTDPDLIALSLPEEQRIIKHLADFPDVIAESGEAFEPHRITFYLMDLAELFHSYYHDNKVLVEDSRTKKARLYLVKAVQQVVANGLEILGVTAPDRM